MIRATHLRHAVAAIAFAPLSIACASFTPPVPTNTAAFNAQNQSFATQAAAKQQSLYSAVMPQLSAIETVSADKAPTPPGSGWFCYESRATRYLPSSPKGETKVERPCHRTEQACRADADRAAARRATGTRERLEVQVSPCAARQTANCSYFWFADGSGNHSCVAGAQDCSAQMLAVTTPGSAVKQAECREVK